jgi:ATP-dependent RNA helicase RhlE
VSFSSFNLHPQIAAGILASGYDEPTPIQQQAMPAVLAGRDVIGLAQTGTGKTAAFGLPILQRLLTGPRGQVRALIIAPTRELAEQIHTAISELGRQTRLRSVTLYGGVGLPGQIQKLRAGVEIVVACPGRLLDHLGQGNLTLKNLEVLVLDEADRMFDMGFLPDIRRLLRYVPAKRQTLLFSATMPDDVGKLAREILTNPLTVQVNHLQPLTTITHALYPVNSHLKTPLLLALLARTDTNSVLVFARTKHRAKKVAEQLKNAGFSAASLQGNLSQNRRMEAMAGFRDGSYQILVATDIAARGIDVTQISHVINYDIPDTPDAYTHRIGRTGRMERTGDAFTLVTPEDRDMVRAIERAMNSALERRTLAGFDYNAAAPAASKGGSNRPYESRAPRAPQHQPSGQAGRPAGRRPSSSNGAPNGAPSRAPAAPHSNGPASRSPSSSRNPAGSRGAPSGRPASPATNGHHAPASAHASAQPGPRRRSTR